MGYLDKEIINDCINMLKKCFYGINKQKKVDTERPLSVPTHKTACNVSGWSAFTCTTDVTRDEER